MEKHKIEIQYELFDGPEGLPEDEIRLLDAAWEALEKAYAPYSGFRVGCAMMLDSGEVFLGSNQENRATPAGICAERSVLFYIGSLGKAEQINKIAIRASGSKSLLQVPAMPCGICRQAIVEFEEKRGKPITLLSRGATGDIIRLRGVADCLLPMSFDVDF